MRAAWRRSARSTTRLITGRPILRPSGRRRHNRWGRRTSWHERPNSRHRIRKLEIVRKTRDRESNRAGPFAISDPIVPSASVRRSDATRGLHKARPPSSDAKPSPTCPPPTASVSFPKARPYTIQVDQTHRGVSTATALSTWLTQPDKATLGTGGKWDNR
jgi:hypothetical protein